MLKPRSACSWAYTWTGTHNFQLQQKLILHKEVVMTDGHGESAFCNTTQIVNIIN